ncbi:MAG: PAS domain S-box protein [Syntrophaceae bacterium]
MSKRATKADLENEIKELRRALERSEQKHALIDKDLSILDNINVTYFELDLKGNLTSFNDNLCRDFGYSREELMGMNFRAYTQPGYVEWVRSVYEEVYSTGRPKTFINDRIIRKDGSLMVAEISVGLICSETGQVTGYRGVGRDITSQTLAMKALEESEARYRLLAENSLDVIWTMSLDGRITYTSPSVTALLGYSQEEILALGMDDLLAAQSLAFIQDLIARELAKAPEARGRSLMLEFRMRAKDGTQREVEANASWFLDDEGRYIGLQGSIRDISARKRAEEALRASEEKYRSILENMAEAYFEIDLKGSFVFANQAAGAMLGYEHGELMGMNYRQYTSPQTANALYDVFNRIYRTGQPESIMDHEVIRKDGMRCIHQLHATLLRDKDGAPSGFSVIAWDVTDRKQAEDALKKSEERYRSILESMQEAYYEVDLSGNFTFFNSTAVKGLGYTADEMMHMNFTAFVDEDNARRVYETYHRVFLTGEPVTSFEWDLTTKSGRILQIESAVFLRRDEQGRPIGFRGIVRDISARKQVQAALRESEEKYRTLVEGSRVVVLRWNTSGDITYINEYGLRFFGYASEELLGRNVVGAIVPEKESSGRNLVSMIDDIRRDPERFSDNENENITKDGRRVWIRWSNKPIQDHNGQLIEILSIGNDITERKQAEEALRQSEEKYRSILETMDESYFELDLKGNYTFFNDALCRDHGYPRSALMGMNYRVYTSPETAWQAYRTFNEIYRTGEAKSLYFEDIIRPDGSRRYIEMSIGPIKDAAGKVTGFRGVGRDVTERNKAQQALKESEERFRDLAMLLPESVFEIDAAGRFTFVNRISLERFGYTEEEVYHGLGILDVIMPEDHARALANARLVDLGENSGLNEYMVRRKDGTVFPALVSTTCIYRDGRLAGRRGFLIDISEKKVIEEQLMRAQKMEAIGTLAGGIAHDFNNLLMGILGNVSLLLMKMDAADPVHDRLKNIEEYVQRGSDLTKQLLGFARGGKYEVKPTDLAEFTHKSSQMFGRTKKEIRIHHKAQADLWTVEVDRGQMEQVLINLYVNAWQAMPGGGDLYVSLENAELDIEQVAPHNLKAGKYVVLAITDTGVGMDEATRARVFEPFFTTKELGRGTGLGLASVYGIIRNHGGFILVESEEGIGTTFIIHLPASARPCEIEPQPEPEVRMGRETILLVDDEEMILEIGSEMLRALGYKVLIASGGRTGLHIYDQHKGEIDLVILDMVMPDLGGRETFEALKRSNHSIKVVLSSGYSLDGQAKEIMQGGCKGFIQKPFNLAELSRKIRQILDEG